MREFPDKRASVQAPRYPCLSVKGRFRGDWKFLFERVARLSGAPHCWSKGGFCGLIAIQIGLGESLLWKPGEDLLELGAVVAKAQVDSLVEEDEVQHVPRNPLEAL